MYKKILKVARPKLFFSDISPPARSCILGIYAMKLDVDMIPVDLFKSEHLKDDFVQMNNLHTVPVLEDRNIILTDSHAILFHMASVLANKTSTFHLGDDPFLQSKILNRLLFNACILFKRDSDAFHDIFHKQEVDMEFHHSKISEAYSYLNSYLKDTKFIASDQMSIADLSCLSTASTLDLLLPIDANKWRNLYNWFQVMKSLPYYKAANEDGLASLKEKMINDGCFKF